MTRKPSVAGPRTKGKVRSGPAGSASPTPSLPLGSTGKLHPPIGLGLWALGRWNREDEARTKAVLGRAIERDVRWVDTAEVYGNGRSERILGEVLARRGKTADGLFLTTKVSWEHLRPSQLRAALVGSLQRLGRSSVDLYLVHAPDPRVPVRETMGALEELWKEGRIGAIGVSNFSVEQIEEAQKALSETEIVANQVRYNLFEREDGDEVTDYCAGHRIVVEAYTPLCRGLLVGRYLDGETPSTEVRRFAKRLFESDRFPELLSRARALRSLAKEANVSMASIALHWLARRRAVPLFGASRPEQVDDNLAAWRDRPSEDVLDRADAIARGDRA